jgi:hypothetical protein
MRIFIEPPDSTPAHEGHVGRALQILKHARIKTRGGGMVGDMAVVMVDLADAAEAVDALAAGGVRATADWPAVV